MTDNTLGKADAGGVLRPSLLAVVMIAAGLGLLFLDNDKNSGNTSSPLMAVSQAP